MTNLPVPFFFLSLLVFWLAGRFGGYLRIKHPLKDEARDDFAIVQAATLTLLGLIIGFSFSMAVSRYDQRKNYEEAEANAIGTEYVRADILPADSAAAVRSELAKYIDLRIRYYQTRESRLRRQIYADTTQLQAQMWTTVVAPAAAHPTPVIALVVSGMNDVLNSQGYTQAAWWNRIPTSAWGLLMAIAICGNILVGYSARTGKSKDVLHFVLPLVIAITFLLIADIDSPRGGLIHVTPRNLISLSKSISR